MSREYTSPSFVTIEGKRGVLHGGKVDAGYLKMFHNFGSEEIRNKVPPLDEKKANEIAVKVTIKRGDVLYVPPFWWHEVVSRGRPSFAMNHWWNTAGWLNKIFKKLDNVISAELPITVQGPQDDGTYGQMCSRGLHTQKRGCGYYSQHGVLARTSPESANMQHFLTSGARTSTAQRGRGRRGSNLSLKAVHI